MKIRIFHIIFLIFLANLLLAQDRNKQQYLQSKLRKNAIEQGKWEKATENLDYSGKPISKKKNKKEKKQRRDYDNWDRNNDTGILGGSLVQLISIGAFAAIVILLLYNLSGAQLNFGGNTKISNSDNINLQQIEENLLESELDQLLRQAIENENYPLAIRLYFLQAIKDMSIKNIIRWKKDKTNRDYLREVKNHPLSDHFKSLSRVFDRVWYGQKPLNKEGFDALQPQFRNFLQAIKKS